MPKNQTKQTIHLSIDEKILEKSKALAKEKNIPLSRLVENFLEFFIDPSVYCFSCGKKFRSKETEICTVCGWMKCPECGKCGCGQDEEVSKAIYHMRLVYEDLVQGRVK